MTDPRLTPAETAALDKRALRWAQAAGYTALTAVALLLVAIWAGDSRYATTAGLALLVAIVCGAVYAVMVSPDNRRKQAARLRNQDDSQQSGEAS